MQISFSAGVTLDTLFRSRIGVIFRVSNDKSRVGGSQKLSLVLKLMMNPSKFPSAFVDAAAAAAAILFFVLVTSNIDIDIVM